MKIVAKCNRLQINASTCVFAPCLVIVERLDTLISIISLKENIMLNIAAWLDQNPEYLKSEILQLEYSFTMIAYLMYCVEYLEERIIDLEAKTE